MRGGVGPTPETIPTRTFAPIRAQFGLLALDWVGPITHPGPETVCSTGSIRPAIQWYWKADFVKEIPDEAVDIHVKYGEGAADRKLG